MINGQYDRAKQILSEHKEGHNRLAQLLFEKEVIYTKDVEEILGKRPFKSRSEEILEENEKLDKAKAADAPKLEDQSDAVKKAQAEYEASADGAKDTPVDNADVPSQENDDNNKD